MSETSKTLEKVRNEISNLKPYVVVEAHDLSPVLVDYNKVIGILNKYLKEEEDGEIYKGRS